MRQLFVPATGDRDGTPDALAGGSDVAGVWSGATGASIHAWTGCAHEFGNAVADVGDANADGWPDLAVYQNGVYVPGCDLGVHVFSGRTGEELLRHLNSTVMQPRPERLSALPRNRRRDAPGSRR